MISDLFCQRSLCNVSECKLSDAGASVHVSEARVSSASRRAVSHGDAVVVEQVRQPLLPGAASGKPLEPTQRDQSTCGHVENPPGVSVAAALRLPSAAG